MADSPAVRQRRSRLHKAATHQLCGPNGGGERPAARDAGERPAGRDEVRTATAKYLASVGATDDQLQVQAVIALRAAEEVDQAATPGSLRALTDLLETYRRHAEHIRYEASQADDQADDW